MTMTALAATEAPPLASGTREYSGGPKAVWGASVLCASARDQTQVRHAVRPLGAVLWTGARQPFSLRDALHHGVGGRRRGHIPPSPTDYCFAAHARETMPTRSTPTRGMSAPRGRHSGALWMPSQDTSSRAAPGRCAFTRHSRGAYTKVRGMPAVAPAGGPRDASTANNYTGDVRHSRKMSVDT